MTCKGSTGSGVTVALSGDTTIGKVRSAQLPEWIAEAVDFTGLSDTTWRCFINGNPADGGFANVEMYFNSEIAIPTISLVQTITFTFPIQTAGNAVNATLIASGFITNLQWPTPTVGEPLTMNFQFKFDGNGTVPAFTLEALS